MRRSSGRRALAFAAFSVFAAACNDPPFIGTISRSQFWEYHDQVDEPLCPTLLSLLDEHTQLYASALGFRPDPGDPFRYYRFRDQETLAATYGSDVGGETFDDSVQ